MNDRIFDFPWLRSEAVVQDPRTYEGVCNSCKSRSTTRSGSRIRGRDVCVCVWRICKEAGLVEGGGQREVMGGG